MVCMMIERLQTLPKDKQAEVFDFIEFLCACGGGSAAYARRVD